MARTKGIELGKHYRDSVSGWEGVATARYEYMNGCIRYEISAKDKDGKPEQFVFDEQQIEPVPVAAVERAPALRRGGARGNEAVER